MVGVLCCPRFTAGQQLEHVIRVGFVCPYVIIEHVQVEGDGGLESFFYCFLGFLAIFHDSVHRVVIDWRDHCVNVRKHWIY